MTVALVTGSHGFVGSHLRPLLHGEGWTVVGVGRSEAAAGAGERYIRADVTAPDEMSGVLDAVRPDVVFHLAAASGQKVSDPVALVRGAVGGTQSLCTSLRRVGLRSRLVLAGSSAQYGAASATRERLVESDPCEPVSAYGHAKAAAESTAFALSNDGAFELVAARAFNHVGPGEPPTTVCGALAARVLSVVEGRAERFPAADLGAVRDFTDVRDIARGYLALAERGIPGRVYNLCSGRGRTVGDVLDGLLGAAGLDRSIVDVLPGDGTGIPFQVGSPACVEADTGWMAGIPLDDSLADLLAWLQGEPVSSGGARRAVEETTGGA